jgi:D-alanyl-D-alanine carboxypeptidase/D-alanyl-D-alanine-endopeptidase (penicillin-binding protein 4)
VSRACLLVLAALTAIAASTAAAPSTRAAAPALDVALDRALRAPGIDPASTAAIAIDVRSGATAYEHNAQRSLLPASAEKLAVSFTALRVLGPRFRFRTEVVGVGTRSGRVWHGHLGLVGYGDPTLDRSDLDRLARKFASTGIRRVAGRVYGDDTHFDARRDALGWKASYLGYESRPLSALAVAGVMFNGANGSAAAAAQAFREALDRRGIAVSGRAGAGRAPGDALTIAFDLSPPLAKIVRLMNAESDNFVAEMVLKELGSTIVARGSTAAGARVVRSTLSEAGVRLAGVRIADGSGLSKYDRATVVALCDILRAGASDSAIDDAFIESLAVAGVSGTLEKRLDRRPTRGRVVGKTGTTNRASALAGFVGRRYVFAILQNGRPVPYWYARAAQDRFVTLLARS